MRFPAHFVDAEPARELQKKIEEEIAAYIRNRSRPAVIIQKLSRENDSDAVPDQLVETERHMARF